MTEAERTLLASVARAILSGDRGELANQLDRPYPDLQWQDHLPPPPPAPVVALRWAETEVPPLVFPNGTGGFTANGQEYVIVLEGEAETPLPWVNVMANPAFGHRRVGFGLGLYLGGEQPGEPSHTICQRSGHRRDLGSAVHPGRRGWSSLVSYSGTIAAQPGQRTLRDTARARRHRALPRRRRASCTT